MVNFKNSPNKEPHQSSCYTIHWKLHWKLHSLYLGLVKDFPFSLFQILLAIRSLLHFWVHIHLCLCKLHITVRVEIFTTCSQLLLQFLSGNLFCVNDCIGGVVTFTTLAKMNSVQSYCSTKVAGLGKYFLPQILFGYNYGDLSRTTLSSKHRLPIHKHKHHLKTLL